MREIVIMPKAQNELNQLFEYLVLKWNLKVKDDFVNKLHLVLKNVAKVQNHFLFQVKILNLGSVWLQNRIHFFIIIMKSIL